MNSRSDNQGFTFGFNKSNSFSQNLSRELFTLKSLDTSLMLKYFLSGSSKYITLSQEIGSPVKLDLQESQILLVKDYHNRN